MLEELRGQIERITFASEETGYTIARLKVYGRRDLVTAVGNLMSPTPGEVLHMKGEWTSHPKYGEQFKVVYFESKVPATVAGIRKYLGSGLVKGIGPVMAKRIVDKFGKKTLDVIEEQFERLAEVDGIGKKRVGMIKQAWDEQKEIREVMIFLQGHGVSSAYASKIYKQYGDLSIPTVRENPYRLAMDIYGIGFITADKIAEKLGFSKDSPVRAEAGIVYVLNKMSDDGHVFYPYEPLMKKSEETLEVCRDILSEALGKLSSDKKIVIEDMNRSVEDFQENNKAVYLSQFFFCETSIARRMKRLISGPKSIRPADSDKAVDWVQEKLSIRLAKNQREAVESALTNKVMVLTGGPGTGKTTIINAILKIFDAMQVRTLLAAPTGRAAKRMGETTGRPAKTLHRLLEFSFQNGGFQKNEEKPLDCDALVVDEASMIDIVLMHHLMKAIPPHATFILVGDVNQLPSVGPGNVLKDIIASRTAAVVELTEIFRQAAESRIVVNAHRINCGDFPLLPKNDPGAPPSDFYFIQKEEPEDVLKIILDLAGDRIPRRFGFDPVNDIQVLTPMHRGTVGASNLNKSLQDRLNPGKESLVRGGRKFQVDDKVMQIRNNYDKKVYNGDMGRILRIDSIEQEITVSYEGRAVSYDFGELDEIVLAYAVSVHKAQGSEYPAVVLPVVTQHYVLLQRNLIYTAVTRARKLVVMVGTKKALAIAIGNDKTRKRYSLLEERISQS